MSKEKVVITEDELAEKYADLLDDLYPVYELEDLKFRPSQIFKDCDPNGWRAYLSDYADGLYRSEGIVTIGHTDHNEEK